MQNIKLLAYWEFRVDSKGKEGVQGVETVIFVYKVQLHKKNTFGIQIYLRTTAVSISALCISK